MRNAGGAINVSAGEAMVTNSVFYRNSALKGGALHVQNGHLVIDNSVLFENQATERGAGLNFSGGEDRFPQIHTSLDAEIPAGVTVINIVTDAPLAPKAAASV